MEKKRPKRGKNSYLNDFQLNLAGEYIYNGELYACAGTDAEIHSLRTRLWAYGGVMLAASIAGGCISAPGMQNCFYVMLPYLAELCAAVSVLWALVRMGTDWTQLRAYVYERTVPALAPRALLTMIFSVLAFAGETVYLFLSGAGGHGFFAILFLLLRAAVFSSGLLIRRRFSRAVWGKVSKNCDG